MARRIRSKNKLLKGQLIEKPPKATVVGEDEDGYDIFLCPHCKKQTTWQDCDICGAEPDCMFCRECNMEFEV